MSTDEPILGPVLRRLYHGMMKQRASGGRQIRRFDVDEVTRMGAAGVFRDDERFELVGGELLTLPPPAPKHSAVVDALARLLLARVGDRAAVRIQNPIQLDQHNLFRPDLALLHPDRPGCANRYPGPADALLVVEVADTMLDCDVSRKLPVYAGAGVSRVWLLDLHSEQVQAFADPAAGGYGATRSCRNDDRLRLLADGEVTARELLQYQAV
jgi:Uma2 family endonuclease